MKKTILPVGTIFTFDEQGACQFSVEDIRQINAKSKISFFGAYLCLNNVDNKDNKPSIKSVCYFIYKDALNLQEYTRLSRIILYCQKVEENNNSIKR